MARELSAGSGSKAITFLESQELIRRERGERRRDRYVVDDDLWYQSMIRSARSNDEFVETARKGVAVLGAGTPAAIRLENAARFLNFVGESLIRAADQGREVLYQVETDRLDQATRAMADVAAQWDRRLAAIKRLAEAAHAESKRTPPT